MAGGLGLGAEGPVRRRALFRRGLSEAQYLYVRGAGDTSLAGGSCGIDREGGDAGDCVSGFGLSVVGVMHENWVVVKWQHLPVGRLRFRMPYTRAPRTCHWRCQS